MKHLMKFLTGPLAFTAVFLLFGTPSAPAVELVPTVGGAAVAYAGSEDGMSENTVCAGLQAVSSWIGYVSGFTGTISGFLAATGVGVGLGAFLFGVSVVTFAMHLGMEVAINRDGSSCAIGSDG